MSKNKIIAIILFNFLSLFLFTYISPETSVEVLKEEILNNDNSDAVVENFEKEIEVQEEKEYIDVNKEINIKTSKIILTPEIVTILYKEDFNIMTGVKIDTGRNLLISSNISDTTTLSIGKHYIIYSAKDINGQKITATRTIQVLDPDGDEDNDGFTNEEELESTKEPQNGNMAESDDNPLVNTTPTNPQTPESHPDTYPPTITLLGNNPYIMLEGEKYQEQGYEITLDPHDKLTTKDNVKVTGTITPDKIGTYELTYKITDRYNKSALTTRTINVLSQKEDEDKDGYTNEEEIANKTNPLDKEDKPNYSKDLYIDISKCQNNMTVYDDIPDFNSCVVVKDEFYETEGIEFNVDTSAIDKNNIGTYKIKITANDNLNNKTEKEFDFEVFKRKVTITIDNKTSEYLENIKELTSNEKEQTISNTNIGVKLTSSVTNNSDVGIYDIVGTWTNNNYDVTFVKGKYTITEKSLAQLTEEQIKNLFNISFPSKITTYNAEVQSTELVGEIPAEIEIKYENNKATNVGVYNAKAFLTGTKNYTGTAMLETTLTINKAPITIKAEDKELTYGDTPSVLTYTITAGQIFYNDNLNITLKREDELNNNAGTYKINMMVEPNSNYEITLIDGTYTINKAIPTYEIPTRLTGNNEMTLSEIELPEGFVYQDDISTKLPAGTHTIKVTYIPIDQNNYEKVTDINVEIVINEVKYYTIKFVDKDGKEISVQSIKENGTAIEPTDILEEYEDRKKTYVFSGWIGNYTNVTKDATITPLYIEASTSTTYAYVLNPEYYAPEKGAGYDSSYYTNALETENGDKIPLSIKISGLTEEQANSIRNQKTTVVGLGEENVMKYLTISTKEQLEAIAKGTDAIGAYTIEWYVLKYQPDGWHLDGYKVYDERKVELTYQMATSSIKYSHIALKFNNAIEDLVVEIDGKEQTITNRYSDPIIGNDYVIAYTKSLTEKAIVIRYKFKDTEYTNAYVIVDEQISKK